MLSSFSAIVGFREVLVAETIAKENQEYIFPVKGGLRAAILWEATAAATATPMQRGPQPENAVARVASNPV